MLTRRPYIPLGCDQQNRVVPTLTARHLDHRQKARDLSSKSLPDLLLHTGAMSGPYRRTRPLRRSRVGRFFRALTAFLLAPSPFHKD